MVELFSHESSPIYICIVAGLLALFAESLHGRKLTRVGRLAFGPTGRPAQWVRAVPLLRGLAVAALTWGLLTLLALTPKVHRSDGANLPLLENPKHVLLVLDVSPSMRLVDSGPKKLQSRMERARDAMESFFSRVPLEQYRITVVAVYNGAKLVVQETSDIEVVRNILGDLPLHFAFPSGKTKLLSGFEEAASVARPWAPRSTTLILISDGDTVPTSGMPKMPDSIASVLVVGVGDPITGKFIDGKQSRQDISTLRQIATRLGGTFHNGNEKNISSMLISDLTRSEDDGMLAQLTRREYALIACGAGSTLLALLPLLLFYLGTRWRPGVYSRERQSKLSRTR
ncbi:MAG: Ca-activated chloride channel family protein [Planctomycetota bacterium]